MLDRTEAVHFLENQLRLVDVERKLRQDKLGLLNDVTRGFAERVPFQNILLLSTPPALRHRPTLEEIKDDMVSLRGGLCYTQAVFGFYLLRALGYDVTLCQATVTSSVTHANNHVEVVARNVEREGDSFLAILPCGYPTFRPVPLDFETESPVYVDGFLEYKYIRHDGKVMRMHRKGDFRPSTRLPFCLYVDDWRRFYETDMRCSDDVTFFDGCCDDVYRKVEASPFHTRLRFMRFPDGRAEILSDARLTRDVGEGKLVTEELQDDVSIKDFLRAACPQLGEKAVEEALKNWKRD